MSIGRLHFIYCSVSCHFLFQTQEFPQNALVQESMSPDTSLLFIYITFTYGRFTWQTYSLKTLKEKSILNQKPLWEDCWKFWSYLLEEKKSWKQQNPLQNGQILSQVKQLWHRLLAGKWTIEEPYLLGGSLSLSYLSFAR